MIFAIDGGGTTFKTCLVDDEGNLSRLESFRLHIDRGVEGMRVPLTKIFEIRSAECTKAGTPIRAIGIGCRGIIDAETKTLLDDSGVMNFFAGHSFRELIDTDLPMGVDNDAVAAAMGENKYGAGREVKNFVLLTLGTGVGGGIVLDGKTLRRSTEMGHFPVNPDGDKCGCGNIGCVEAEFSVRGLEPRIEEADARRPVKRKIRHVKRLFELARGGDRDALDILDRGTFYLARAISGYANALDPDRVILSGGISKGGEFLKSLLVEQLKPILWRKDPETFVEISRLGAEMGLYGAGAVGAAELKEE